MNYELDTLRSTKTVLLSTHKRDGTPVATPVSIAFERDRAFFRSYDKAWKAKRLRNNPNVEVAASTFRGRPTGPAIAARAVLLANGEAEIAAHALARQHRALQGVLVPVAHRVLRYRTVHYELILGEGPAHESR